MRKRERKCKECGTLTNRLSDGLCGACRLQAKTSFEAWNDEDLDEACPECKGIGCEGECQTCCECGYDLDNCCCEEDCYGCGEPESQCSCCYYCGEPDCDEECQDEEGDW